MTVVPFSKGGGGMGSGGDAGGPTIEHRVGQLEVRAERIEATLQRLEVAFGRFEGSLSQMPKANDFASLKADVAEMKGKIAGLPTTWQLLLTVIGTWSSGAAIVFALVKFGTR